LCDNNGITVPDRIRNASLLKSMHKMVCMERICKQIYQYLGWEFKPWKI